MAARKLNTKIFQIYYDDKTKQHLDPQFTPLLNTKCSKYFADEVIARLFDEKAFAGTDYAGVLSWRMKQKAPYWIPDFKKFIDRDRSRHDFYFFAASDEILEGNLSFQSRLRGRVLTSLRNLRLNYGVPGAGYFTRYPEKSILLSGMHHGMAFLFQLERIVQALGYNVRLNELVIRGVHYSSQVCKTELYQEYVDKMLKPAMAYMDDPKNADLQKWLNEPDPYVRTADPLSGEALKVITGRPHYTKHVFITERLFPIYAGIRGWRGLPFF